MFSHLTREDRLAIFQKFSPVCFSRVIRTCKWANEFVETNKRKIKIHTDKILNFQLPEYPLCWPLATCVERVIKVMSAERVLLDRVVLEEIPCNSREYETILAEPRFQCFVFAQVENEEYAEMILRDEIDILNLPPSALDSAFDLAESNRNVMLHFPGVLSNPQLVNRYCELLEKIVEQKIVTERIYVSGGISGEKNPPEMLTFFLGAKKSETMVLAEGFEIFLIPVTEKTFLAVYWRFNQWALNEAKLIGSRETLYEHVIALSR